MHARMHPYISSRASSSRPLRLHPPHASVPQQCMGVWLGQLSCCTHRKGLSTTWHAPLQRISHACSQAKPRPPPLHAACILQENRPGPGERCNGDDALAASDSRLVEGVLVVQGEERLVGRAQGLAVRRAQGPARPRFMVCLVGSSRLAGSARSENTAPRYLRCTSPFSNVASACIQRCHALVMECVLLQDCPYCASLRKECTAPGTSFMRGLTSKGRNSILGFPYIHVVPPSVLSCKILENPIKVCARTCHRPRVLVHWQSQ
jgi:hypothetical protein